MRIRIPGTNYQFRIEIAVEISVPSNPCEWDLKHRRKLAHEILRYMARKGMSDNKIQRIKALRSLSYGDRRFVLSPTDFLGLKEAKRFVDITFGDNGVGDVL